MKQYTMKKEIFDRIQTDLPLRSKIANSKGLQGNSIRVNAINKSVTLTEYNTVQIIKEHLNLKDSDIFSIKEVK